MSTVASPEASASLRPGGRIRSIRVWARGTTAPRIALAVLSAALYLPGLDQNGWANAYYSAAVQAASRSWTSFWFASADMGNLISVDKPPLSLWVMALSARIFGFSPWSMLVPQALMGIGTVLLVHAMCRSFLPRAYALFAGAAVATTPVAVLMFRYNNPDALLVLFMTICAWATLRALRSASLGWPVIVGIAIGLGFMTKQLQVLLIAPAVAACLLGSRRFAFTAKVKHVAMALATATVTGLTWFLAVGLVPSGSRPFVGGSRADSVWELTLGYNGLDRLTGLDAARTASTDGGDGPASGFIRFIYPNYAGQVSWLLPLAVTATLVVVFLAIRGRARSVPAPVAFAVVWWWASVPVLAYMGGIVHPYYALVVVPPTAILAAWMLRLGLHRTATRWSRRTLAVGLLAALLLNLIIIGIYARGYQLLLGGILLAGAVVTAALMLPAKAPRAVARMVNGLAAVALLAGSLVWSVDTTLAGHVGSSPSAGPPTIIGLTDSPSHQGFPPSMTPANEAVTLGIVPGPQLVSRIQLVAPQQGWAAAAVGGQNAALAALTTNTSILPLGGFDGADPAPTLADFQHLVAQQQIGGLIVGTLPPGAHGETDADRIIKWVEKTYVGTNYGSVNYYSFTEPR